MGNQYPMEWQILDFYNLPKEIRKYERVYIYGAGMVGSALLEYLYARNLGNKVEAFIESYVLGKKIHKSGVPIIDIHNALINSNNLVLLAAKRELRSELKKVCDVLHIENVKEINSYDDRDYDYYSSIPEEIYPIELKDWYHRITGEELDLDNPQTFNEKINWMKIYDKDERKTFLADKYLVREYVKEKIGEEYLVPLLGVWENFDEIDFNKLPDRFVLKCNHGCGWNIIVKDKDEFDYINARNSFNQWIRTNYAFIAGLETHYKKIKPRIIAEEYLENSNDDLFDYKFWCFNGKAKFIMFLSNRRNNLLMDNYDLKWKLLPFTYDYPNSKIKIEKPNNLDNMIKLAEILSKGFNFVRVDFYRMNDGNIKFGEMTFSPASGVCGWSDKDINSELGKLIRIKD